MENLLRSGLHEPSSTADFWAAFATESRYRGEHEGVDRVGGALPFSQDRSYILILRPSSFGS